MRGRKFIKERKEAIQLRKKGLSIVVIEKQLGINRSTLSGWFRNIILTVAANARLEKARHLALANSRKKAVVWHNAQKAIRLAEAKRQAELVLDSLELRNGNILDLAMAFLYFGEGFKSNTETGIGNSDPLVLRIFLYVLEKNYGINIRDIRCELHLRADQNPEKIKEYWSKELDIPLENFKHVSFDKRTIGSKTYATYKGVCCLRCANVAIQRKLVNISRGFCERLLLRV